MSSTRLSLFICAAAAVLAGQGCETQSEKLQPPKSTITLILNPDDRKEISALPMGSAIRIVLPPPMQGPSYAWELTSNNEKVLRQISPIKAEKGPNGEIVSYSAVFQSLRPSPPRSILTFAAVRPGERDSEPKDVYQVVVGVKSPQ